MEANKTDITPGKHPIEFRSVWVMVRVLYALGAAHGLFALLVFVRLPERIPIHFDLAGNPDGFAGTSLGSWFLLWFTSVGCGVLFGWFSLRLDRIRPSYYSLPRRDEFIALPAPAKSRVFAAISFHMLVFTGIFMLFFFAMHICMALAALQILDGMPNGVVYGGIAVVTIDTIVLTVRIVAAINREIDQYVLTR